jgi:hypothetical protein
MPKHEVMNEQRKSTLRAPLTQLTERVVTDAQKKKKTY